MTTRQAPEIFQIPLDDLDPAGLPPRGTPEFEQAVIGRYALDYAARGWQAADSTRYDQAVQRRDHPDQRS